MIYDMRYDLIWYDIIWYDMRYDMMYDILYHQWMKTDLWLADSDYVFCGFIEQIHLKQS